MAKKKFVDFLNSHNGKWYGSGQCYAGTEEYLSWGARLYGICWWYPYRLGMGFEMEVHHFRKMLYTGFICTSS